MSKMRLWSGVALLGAGAAAGAFAVRGAAQRQAQAEAAARAAAAQQAADRLAAAEREIESVALQAAVLRPLNAALENHVDGPTLIDLFDNEDWWQPYRDEFTATRVYVADARLASRGKLDLETQDAEAVTAARKQRVGSSLVTIAGQRYLVGAARLPALPDREPVLVLARPLKAATLAAPAPPAVVPARLTDRPLPLVATGALGLVGLALLISSRGRRPAAVGMPGGVSATIPREPTLKFGTGGLPQPGHNPAAAAVSISSPPRPTPTIRPPQAAPSPPTPPPAPRAPDAAAPTPIAPSPTQPEPGGTFGRYRLLDRLGEGGMSELFTAEARGVQGFSRTFVLKRLRPELARDKEAVAQFIDEARMQASLVHSNIVPVFDFGVVSGEYFITQEYIAGRDLVRLMSRYQQETGRTSLEPRLAYYIAHETLQALAYAHGRCDKTGSPMGIVHRDVSAGNIIVSLQGEVKLSDFGIVKSNKRVTKTQVGMVKGNANFMSPEQARGLTVDGRSDLFSLAQVLYFCMTNELLYSGDNDLDVLYKAATGPTVEDYRKMRDLPDPAGPVLEKALAFDPAERFQTAVEFAGALAAHTGGGKSDAARLLQALFGDELRHEAA